MVFERDTVDYELYNSGGENGSIAAIDIKNNLMAIGYENGSISFIDIVKSKHLKEEKIICLIAFPLILIK
jgi:hypothetical protein